MQKYFMLLFLAVAFTTSSCRKDRSGFLSAQAASTSQLSFTVGTSTVKSATGDVNVSAVYYKDVKTLQVIGKITDTEGISLMVNQNFNGVGQYDASGDFLGSYSVSITNPLQDTYLSSDGFIKITSYGNNYIKGEFEFTGENSNGDEKAITKGTFEAKVITI